MSTKLERIGNCISGVLYQPGDNPNAKGLGRYPAVLQRMALATQKAFNELNKNAELLKVLDQNLRLGIKGLDQVKEGLFLGDFDPKIYRTNREEWYVFGIRLHESVWQPGTETAEYNASEERIFSDLQQGRDRKVFLAVHGIIAEGIEDLSESLYAAFLGRVHEHIQPDPQSPTYIKFRDDLRFDKITTTDGRIEISISKSLLDKETAEAFPQLVDLEPNIPLNPVIKKNEE